VSEKAFDEKTARHVLNGNNNDGNGEMVCEPLTKTGLFAGE